MKEEIDRGKEIGKDHEPLAKEDPCAFHINCILFRLMVGRTSKQPLTIEVGTTPVIFDRDPRKISSSQDDLLTSNRYKWSNKVCSILGCKAIAQMLQVHDRQPIANQVSSNADGVDLSGRDILNRFTFLRSDISKCLDLCVSLLT